MRILLTSEFLLAYVIGFFCIYLPDGFYKNFMAEDLVIFMRSIIPSVNGYWERSRFPEVSAFYLSVQPLIFLPAFIRMIKEKDICFDNGGLDGVYLYIKKKRFPSLIAILGVVLFVLLAFVFYAQPGYQFGLMPVNEKRWALGIFGPIVGFGSVYFSLALAWHYFSVFLRTLRD